MDYKTYLQEELTKLVNRINELKEQIKNTLPKEEINYLNYGSKKQLIKQYKSKMGKKPRKWFFFTDEDLLKEYIHDSEIERIETEISDIEDKMKQVENALASFDGTKFTTRVAPNQYVIKTLIEYSSLSALSPKAFLVMLISLFKPLTKNEENLFYAIERNVADAFDDNYMLLDTIELDSLFFMLDKIIWMAYDRQDVSAFETFITDLKAEIEAMYKKSARNEQKLKLEKKKAALAKLQTIIIDDQIVSTMNIEEFTALLMDAEIKLDLQQQYITAMADLLKEEKIKKTNMLLQKYLSPQEQEIYAKSVETVKICLDEEIKELLNRLNKDIVSLCSYIQMLESPEEIAATYALISEKINLIRITAAQLQNTETQSARNIFAYVTDSENIPMIFRDIEKLDIIHYSEIIALLKELNLSNDGYLIGVVDGIEIYAVASRNVEITFAKDKDNIIIIGASIAQIGTKRHLALAPSTIARLKKIMQSPKDSNFTSKQEIYENLILQLLDLNSVGEVDNLHTLKKIIEP